MLDTANVAQMSLIQQPSKMCISQLFIQVCVHLEPVDTES